MFTDKHYPSSLPLCDMDTYLSNGWYRMGQAVFTCQFLFMEKQLHSAIWIRLPLQNYSFRKSLSKMFNRNRRRFKTIIRPVMLDSEKENLFQSYKKIFRGRLSPTLKIFLQANSKCNIYNTYEACIFDGEKLVAFSMFDLCERSIASIIGIYHPEYARSSLGFYTMLLEVEYGRAHGFDYFYPGYIVPGYSPFDYKLRIGKVEEIEYFNLKDRNWQPIGALSNEKIPIRVIDGKLSKLLAAFHERGIASEILYYPAFEANLFGYAEGPYLDAPVFVTCYPDPSAMFHHIIYYDFWKETFVFCRCLQLEDLTFFLHYSGQFDSPERKHFLDILLKKEDLHKNPSVSEIAEKASEVGWRLESKQVRRNQSKVGIN